MDKKMPIGLEFYSKLITEDYYYVDKTLFIKELLDNRADVNLFTRPRRFGKTLMLTTLQCFFEKAYDVRGERVDNSYLFRDTLIAGCDDKYLTHMGQYPVICLTLKSGKQSDMEGCLYSLGVAIAGEFKRHKYILSNEEILSPIERDRYQAIMDNAADIDTLKDSIRFLCECLHNWSGKNVIVLIDEYDVPLEGAYHYGFYERMADFIRVFFETSLKTNPFLYFSVITGCLRVSRESIFTGLNNLHINTVLSEDYGEYFGFTESEVLRLCEDYGLTDNFDEIRQWYDGYMFGEENIYNPWSVIQYVYDHRINKSHIPESYWVNTSSNSIVRDLVSRADDETKRSIERLIARESITVPVHEDITYDEIYDSPDNLWNFMLFTGYLKKTDIYKKDAQTMATLTIPNMEVWYIFNRKIISWFEEKVKETDRSLLFNGIFEGDTAAVTDELLKLLISTISFHDYQENFYHGFLVGVLTGIDGCTVKSNREAGDGRSDIFIKPHSRRREAVVIEIKIADSIAELEVKADEAIRQIIEKRYEQELIDDGYLATKRYGVAFFKKDCLVVSG